MVLYSGHGFGQDPFKIIVNIRNAETATASCGGTRLGQPRSVTKLDEIPELEPADCNVFRLEFGTERMCRLACLTSSAGAPTSLFTPGRLSWHERQGHRILSIQS